MNTTLLYNELKNNMKSFITLLIILTMYVLIIISMYDPQLQSLLDQFSSTIPSLFEAFGMLNQNTSLNAFIINYLYGFILLLLPIIYCIYLNYKLVIQYIESKSLNYILSSTISRKVFIQTQILTTTIILFLLMLYITFITLLTSQILFPNQLDISAYLLLNIGLLSLQYQIIAILFLLSVLIKDCKKILAYASTFITISYLCTMLVNMNEQLYILKYTSIFSLFNTQHYIQYTTDNLLFIAAMLCCTLCIHIITINSFNKRDLIL